MNTFITIMSADNAPTEEGKGEGAGGRTRSWNSFLESAVKISLCAFGGSIVGLAHQQRMEQFEGEVASARAAAAAAAAVSGAADSPHPHGEGQQQQRRKQRRRFPLRHGPPQKIVATRGGSSALAASSSLPGKWGLACMFFALILESSRAASPTSMILNEISDRRRKGGRNGDGGGDDSNDDESEDSRLPTAADAAATTMQERAATSIGDYAFGGTVAGLSGALALARNVSAARKGAAAAAGSSSLPAQVGLPPPAVSLSHFSRPGLILWGIGAGMALGVAAGIIQAGVDVGNMYIELEQKQQKNALDEENTSAGSSGEAEKAG